MSAQPARRSPTIRVLLLACALFGVSLFGLLAPRPLIDPETVLPPWWVVALLVLVWLALLLFALAWWTPRPHRLPWLAVAGVVIWVLVVIVGNIALAG